MKNIWSSSFAFLLSLTILTSVVTAVFFLVENGWYPAGYNADLNENETRVLKRGWLEEESIIILKTIQIVLN